jgi:hypothetical protein
MRPPFEDRTGKAGRSDDVGGVAGKFYLESIPETPLGVSITVVAGEYLPLIEAEKLSSQQAPPLLDKNWGVLRTH